MASSPVPEIPADQLATPKLTCYPHASCSILPAPLWKPSPRMPPLSTACCRRLSPYNVCLPEPNLIRRLLPPLALTLALCLSLAAQATKQQLLWQKLESSISDTDRELDGVLGVYVEDLASGEHYSLHADQVFAQASSIKIAVLAELYRQAGQGKLKLADLYTVNSADLVADSYIMNGLTPGITRITLRDLATMMVAVSDNSATNVLIDRVGMENVNALLDSLSLSHTRLRRKMMDVQAAAQGRENISTPSEMASLLRA